MDKIEQDNRADAIKYAGSSCWIPHNSSGSYQDYLDEKLKDFLDFLDDQDNIINERQTGQIFKITENFNFDHHHNTTMFFDIIRLHTADFFKNHAPCWFEIMNHSPYMVRGK